VRTSFLIKVCSKIFKVLNEKTLTPIQETQEDRDLLKSGPNIDRKPRAIEKGVISKKVTTVLD
jgi:hypothetical protein